MTMRVLATDLDGSFLGGSLHDRDKLYQLVRSSRDKLLLIFVTGRALENVKPILADPSIPVPDFIIADVGSTVVHGRTLEPLEPIDGEFARRWAGEARVLEALPRNLVLERQQQAQERRCSFYTGDPNVVDVVRKAVALLGCDTVYSAGRYLDVLPSGINKGTTLARVIGHLGIDPDKVLVAGDSLNDLSMFVDTAFRGVVVGGSEPTLKELTKHRRGVHYATKHGAGGISEAIEAFNFIEEPSETVPNGSAELVIVYHRQPFDETKEHGKVKRSIPASPNGIIPTLLGLFSSGRKGAWIAWSRRTEETEFAKRVKFDNGQLENLTVSRLPLTDEDIDLFYQKFSKEALWPTLHSFIERASFNHRHWQHFMDVNRRFAREAAAEAAKGALVWIHDYNLWLVPEYLRQLRPDVRIAFFHHTPFPAADIFNVIPWSGEIIASLLKCDHIGFHIPRYVENFVDTARSHFALTVKSQQRCDDRFISGGNALSVDEVTTEIEYKGRSVSLGAHPVGLDLKRIKACLQSPKVKAAVEVLRHDLAGKKIIVCAERLDYMKGPLQKLLAFEQFLALHPVWREKLAFINICSPSSNGMTVYDDIRLRVEQAVGRINGRFSTATWTPVSFMYRQVGFEELAGYLAIADVAWITPLRDGLNLVGKEYVAIRTELKEAGALIMSEFAGSSVELRGALLTNPNDLLEMADTLQKALVMSDREQRERMHRLGSIVRKYDVDYWAQDFIQSAHPATRLSSGEARGRL